MKQVSKALASFRKTMSTGSSRSSDSDREGHVHSEPAEIKREHQSRPAVAPHSARTPTSGVLEKRPKPAMSQRASSKDNVGLTPRRANPRDNAKLTQPRASSVEQAKTGVAPRRASSKEKSGPHSRVLEEMEIATSRMRRANSKEKVWSAEERMREHAPDTCQKHDSMRNERMREHAPDTCQKHDSMRNTWSADSLCTVPRAELDIGSFKVYRTILEMDQEGYPIKPTLGISIVGSCVRASHGVGDTRCGVVTPRSQDMLTSYGLKEKNLLSFMHRITTVSPDNESALFKLKEVMHTIENKVFFDSDLQYAEMEGICYVCVGRVGNRINSEDFFSEWLDFQDYDPVYSNAACSGGSSGASNVSMMVCSDKSQRTIRIAMYNVRTGLDVLVRLNSSLPTDILRSRLRAAFNDRDRKPSLLSRPASFMSHGSSNTAAMGA